MSVNVLVEMAGFGQLMKYVQIYISYKQLFYDPLHMISIFPLASDFIMKLTSHISSQPKSDVDRRDLSPLREEHSVIKLTSGDAEPSPYDITVVVDPASEKAQEIIPIVMVSYVIMLCHR